MKQSIPTCAVNLETLERKYFPSFSAAAVHTGVGKEHDHYGLQLVCYDEDEAVLKQADTDTARRGDNRLESVKVVCRPHRSHARELRWRAQQGNEKYNVSIDMYDVGVLMMHRGQIRQHFVLR